LSPAFTARTLSGGHSSPPPFPKMSPL